MPKSCLFILLLILAAAIQSRAQLDNRFFYDLYPVQETDSGAIKLGFDLTGYFWNNEYSSDIAPGYTLFGYQFRPYFSFYPSRNIRIDLGGFFMKDFGDSGFADYRPIMTIKFQKKSFSFLFGTLEGSATHRLIEPLYYLQRTISKRVEDGVQFKWVTDRLFFDVWLDWVNMIWFGDDEQEEFNVGISFSYQVYRSDRLHVEIPFQLLANHRGGQIDNNDQPAETLYNAALGFSLTFPFPGSEWLDHIRTDNYFADYFTGESPAMLPWGQGEGVFLNLSGQLRWFNITLSYWNGNKFIAPQGTPIYQSVAIDYPASGIAEEKRELFFLRLMYEHEFPGGLSLSARFEPVYDFGEGKLNHMEVLFLRYRTDFLLNRKKK